ncbi:MAG: type III secretion system export apparatus subunit SctU [Chlamydiota bacterium]
MAEKSEKATPKKIRDARKKGQVAKAQDFPSAFTFIVSIASVITLSGYLYNLLASYMILTFRSISGNIDLQRGAAGYVGQAMYVMMQCSLPVLILTVITGLFCNVVVVGPLFALEAVKPDVKRLNPVTNLKNIFKFKTAFELLKSVFKITGAFVLIYSVVYNSIPEIISTAALPVIGSAMVFSDFLIKVIIRVGIFFIAIAIFDLVFQKKNFAKEMKMEKFEVKQEHKDTEGDPHIKSRRRQIAQEIAYQEGPAATKRAKAVITNPTHLAIAVEYNEETEPAPKIVTMGRGIIAAMIIKIATENNVPIMRNVPLAHTLFQKGKIGDYIPEEAYQAVAEVLKWLEQLEKPESESVELFQ